MSLFDDKLSLLLNHRLTWLSARSNIMAVNIAHADIKGTTRKEIRPFQKVLKSHNALPNKSGTHTQILRIGTADTMTTKTEISRELEMLEMSRNALEHDAILSTVKNFHQLVKTILSMAQGG